jgi:hypothetical protein
MLFSILSILFTSGRAAFSGWCCLSQLPRMILTNRHEPYLSGIAAQRPTLRRILGGVVAPGETIACILTWSRTAVDRILQQRARIIWALLETPIITHGGVLRTTISCHTSRDNLHKGIVRSGIVRCRRLKRALSHAATHTHSRNYD